MFKKSIEKKRLGVSEALRRESHIFYYILLYQLTCEVKKINNKLKLFSDSFEVYSEVGSCFYLFLFVFYVFMSFFVFFLCFFILMNFFVWFSLLVLIFLFSYQTFMTRILSSTS
jgi:hypothetical protein